MPPPPSGRGKGGLRVWAERGGLWGMSPSWPDAGGERGRTGWNICGRWERGSLVPLLLAGERAAPAQSPSGWGKEPSARPGERRAFGGKRASSPILGRRGGRTDKIFTGAGERPWSTAPCEGWGRPRRFLGTGNGRSVHLEVGGWRFEGRDPSPPDFGAGSDKSSRPLQVLGEGALSRCPLCGGGSRPHRLWGGGTGRLRALGEGRVRGKRPLLARYWWGEGEKRLEPPLLRHPRDGGKGGRAPGEGRTEKNPFPVGRRRCEGRTGGKSLRAPEGRVPGHGGEESRKS